MVDEFTTPVEGDLLLISDGNFDIFTIYFIDKILINAIISFIFSYIIILIYQLFIKT